MFKSRKIRAVLCDIAGVLHNAFVPIEGSLDGVNKLIQLEKRHGLKFLFCTNTDTFTFSKLISKLNNCGFSGLTHHHVFSTNSAALDLIQKKNLNPLLLIHPEAMDDFNGLSDPQKPFDSVILGDMEGNLNYNHLNDAFRVLIENKSAHLYATGGSRYYRDSDSRLSLDVGSFYQMLQFSTSKNGTVIGKPSREFYATALQKLDCQPEEAIMIGDDIKSDVGGAQAAGIAGILVRTGKYTPEDEKSSDVKPDFIFDNFASIISELETYFEN